MKTISCVRSMTRGFAFCQKRVRTIGLVAVAIAALGVTSASAQYYQVKPGSGSRQVLEASRHDSVIVTRLTPFELPSVPDSIELTYHEPMPDSIMPASAIVIGQISLRMEDYKDIVPYMEKYAHKAGADWIISFNEPKGHKTRDGEIYYVASALLVKVLDPTFVQQDKLQYSYYDDQHVTDYAGLQQYLGKQVQMGAKVDQPQPAVDSNDGQ
jgi:hypothetical protein